MALGRWTQLVGGLLIGSWALLSIAGSIAMFSMPFPRNKWAGLAVTASLLLGSLWALAKSVRLIIGRPVHGGLMGSTSLTVAAWLFISIPIFALVLAASTGSIGAISEAPVFTALRVLIFGMLFVTLRRMAKDRRDEELLATRMPTSHERAAGQPWDASYQGGPAPWDIDRPQPAIVRLAAAQTLASPVLDAGCGTGENALHLASLGSLVLGVDVSPTALTIAARKAAAIESQNVAFIAADAFHLDRLGRTFATVIDCGLFHAFDRDERPRYAASLAKVTERNALLYVLCFSDQGPDLGPHPISKADLTAAFNAASGWNIERIQPERIETRFHDNGVSAWLATMKRM